MSPTQRAKAILRKYGWEAAIVERWCAWAKRDDGQKGVRQDLFGFIDLIAMKDNTPLLAIQVTSTSNISARVEKSLASPLLAIWLSTGALFEVWGFSKKGTGPKKHWTLDKQSIQRLDMPWYNIVIPNTIVRACKMI